MILNNLKSSTINNLRLLKSTSNKLNFIKYYSTTQPSNVEKKKNLLGLERESLYQLVYSKYPKVKLYNIDQLWDWMYVKGVESFDSMTSLPGQFRLHLTENYELKLPTTSELKTSTDGTIKRLLQFDTPKEQIETVMIPEGQRRTLCLSSQIGCSLSCSFCNTGTQKLLRNLTSSEILGQYMVFAKSFGDVPVKARKKKNLKNLVFMGQGEPLYNYKNLSQAIRTLTDPKGINFSKHKITVSTSGVVPLIPNLAKDLGVSLAVSLHAVTDDIRNELVPLNKQFNIQELLTACKQFSKLSTPANQRITFEYVMLKGVNDSLADAKELIRLTRGINSHVNLIPFNPWPGSQYECTPIDQIKEFSQHLLKHGLKTNIRYSKGQDIMAACGQLRSSNQLKKKFESLQQQQNQQSVE